MKQIITFYSYKGGVGRTFALANIGVLLAKRGKKVLLIDFDLEAPGLHRYFQKHIFEDFRSKLGLIHLLHEATKNAAADWRMHVQDLHIKTETDGASDFGRLSMIYSGVCSENYAELVNKFSWDVFFSKQGAAILDRWRREWLSEEEFDFVLIDSRTGITDIGGVCNTILPDYLVLVFMSNLQSFHGAMSMARDAQEQRRRPDIRRDPLLIVPLLSRFDITVENEKGIKWMNYMLPLVKPFYDVWLPKQYFHGLVVERTTIPYVPIFSFGEPLPAITHSLTNPQFPGFYMEYLVDLLVAGFKDVDDVIKDKYVRTSAFGESQSELLHKLGVLKEERDKLRNDQEVLELELNHLKREIGPMESEVIAVQKKLQDKEDDLKKIRPVRREVESRLIEDIEGATNQLMDELRNKRSMPK